MARSFELSRTASLHSGYLFAERDWNRQGVSDFPGRLQVVEWAGLFKEDGVDVLQHPAHFDRLGPCVLASNEK
jgi:hypothetical protein